MPRKNPRPGGAGREGTPAEPFARAGRGTVQTRKRAINPLSATARCDNS